VAPRYSFPSTERVAEAAYATGASAVVFLLFVAAGCAYIVLAKFAGIGPFYVTFVPVGTMLAYALLIYSARGLRLRDDQSGDNLYYMGFLFTLTSLGVSLYQFTAARAAEEIVQNFGIAIGSTIAGIGLRVIFNQMRRDPVEVERMMRLELAEAARRVRRELDSTVVEFGHQRRSAQQAAADSFKHVTEKFDEMVAKFLGSLEDITAKLAGPLEAGSRRSGDAIAEASARIGAKLAESGRQISAASDALSERVGAISSALDDVAAKLGAMQTPDRVIEVRLEPITHSLTQAVDRFAAQSGGQAAAVKAALEQANAATKESIELIATARQELGATADSNRVALEAASKAVVGVAEILDDFKTSSRDYVEILRVLLEKTDATMRTFTEILVKSGVETATQSDSLREVLPAMEANAQTLVTAAERISRAIEDLRARRPSLEREPIA
jgi:ABC-type transporter Mla subunit MlaD